MMTGVRQMINAVYMYLYYVYYDYKMRTDRQYRVREAMILVKQRHAATLRKLAQYEKEHPWRL